MNSKVNEWLDAALRGERNTSALVIHGPQGSGKGVAVKLLERIAKGKKFIQLESHLWHESFVSMAINRAMTNADVVVFDECDIELVKPLIVDGDVQVEAKGRDPEIKPIKANLILTPVSMPVLQDHERRLVITTPLEVIAILIGKIS